MNNRYIRIALFACLFSCVCIACDDLADPIVEELDVDRAFTPIGVEARIRNKTTIELNWKVREDADHYVVEFAKDSLKFASIVRTVTVKPDELPLQATNFDSESRYSARIKSVSAVEGVAESKWAQVTIMTELENIFLPVEDVDKNAATLTWPAGSEVTHLIINPGGVRRDITTEERAAGTAGITGLSEATTYTALIYNDAKQRGSIEFTTLVDGIAVRPDQDLNAVVAAASPGDVLVLYPGEYLVYTGIITINKSISIRGLYPNNRPVVHAQFSFETGAANVTVTDLVMDGTSGATPTVLDHAFVYNTSGTYGNLVVKNCKIYDYGKSLAAGSSSVSGEISSILFDNCEVTNVQTISADFIDFRAAYVGSVTLTNSTFNKCAPGRDFIRLDAAAGLSGTGKTSAVLIDHCTLYGVSNTQDRILYVRFVNNTLTVKNTIIAATDGYYTNQSGSSQPVCSNNNYFNAIGFFTDVYVANAKYDNSGTHRTLDPGFADAAAGNFKISNQTLIDNAVGDPRWRQ